MNKKTVVQNSISRRQLLKYSLYGAATGMASSFGLQACHKNTTYKNVIFILIDTLRADHVGAYGYFRDTTPFLDDFARNHLMYDLAIAPAPWTCPSMASIFTSLYPSAHGVFKYREEDGTYTMSSIIDPDLITLAEVLQQHGYRTAGVTANAWVAEDLGFAQGFDTFVTVDYSSAEKLNEEAVKILNSKDFVRSPFFLYVHYMEPHSPYNHPESYAVYHDRIEGTHYSDDAHILLNRYDNAIHYLDAKLAELFAYLEEKDLYDDSIIVITADHGEEFGEHGGFTGAHGFNVHQEDVHVPLLLKTGRLKKRVSRVVSVIDLYPTLLDLLEIPFDSTTIQGISLFEREKQSVNQGVFSEGTQMRLVKAFVDPGGNKLQIAYHGEIDSIVGKDAPPTGSVLYHLPDDPFELHPLVDEPLLQNLSAQFDKIYMQSLGYRQGIHADEIDLPPKLVEQLKGLGYLK